MGVKNTAAVRIVAQMERRLTNLVNTNLEFKSGSDSRRFCFFSNKYPPFPLEEHAYATNAGPTE
jgi:hypothetical protein